LQHFFDFLAVFFLATFLATFFFAGFFAAFFFAICIAPFKKVPVDGTSNPAPDHAGLKPIVPVYFGHLCRTLMPIT
jgi:hypothetical protein